MVDRGFIPKNMAFSGSSNWSKKASSGVLWEKAVSQQATLYPMARSLFAVASPKPEAAPVTMAILHRGCMTISGLEERK